MDNIIEAVIIEPGGEVRVEQLQRGCEPLQRLVGGWIEAVYSDTADLTFWINEEGKLIGLEPNMLGTACWLGTNVDANDTLCGTVVITGGVDDEGETLTIPADLRDKLLTALNAVNAVDL